MANSYYSQTYLDYSGEKSNVRLRVEEITTANIASQLTQVTALGAAIAALSIGTLHKASLIQDDSLISNTKPTSPFAQRETKWLVIYRDTVTEQLYSYEIPCADLSAANLSGNTDDANLSSSEWAAFITAFEAVVLSPDGNAVDVVSAKHVGRKS